MSLNKDIKMLIIESLNLEGVEPDEIDDQAPLFGDGLGLDSIDALELGLAIKNRYNITLSSDKDQTQTHFHSINSLAAFIQSQTAH